MITLIGDLVASKRHADRPRLQLALAEVLRWANAELEPAQDLEVTIGDEFQGVFASVADAVRASLLLRLALLTRGETDSRYGLGQGEVTVFDAERSPTSQDGPGWWAARAAIDDVRALADIARTSYARTALRSWPDASLDGPELAAIDAFLLCRDALVDHMNARQRRLLLGFLLGRHQTEIAAEEGITQGAVSQSLRRSGAFAIAAGQQRLDEGPR